VAIGFETFAAKGVSFAEARARVNLDRQQAQAIPNLSLSTKYQKSRNQVKKLDWLCIECYSRVLCHLQCVCFHPKDDESCC